jgi:hypothetical protein
VDVERIDGEASVRRCGVRRRAGGDGLATVARGARRARERRAMNGEELDGWGGDDERRGRRTDEGGGRRTAEDGTRQRRPPSVLSISASANAASSLGLSACPVPTPPLSLHSFLSCAASSPFAVIRSLRSSDRSHRLPFNGHCSPPLPSSRAAGACSRAALTTPARLLCDDTQLNAS